MNTTPEAPKASQIESLLTRLFKSQSGGVLLALFVIATGFFSVRSAAKVVRQRDRLESLKDVLVDKDAQLAALIEKQTEMYKQLEASNKELDAFCYSVSHDLKGPLRALEGFSKALAEDHGDSLDEDGKKLLDRVRKAGERMFGLIDGLLELSRLTDGELRLEEVNLSELVVNITDDLKELNPDRGSNTTISVQPDLYGQGDLRLLRVVLTNLLENAWKYSGKTPHAYIEFGQTERDGVQTYFVSDNGAGFDMAYASKLFEPFGRLHTTEEFEGTGIGLATVAKIVHRHGGTIAAEGVVGKGATFYFTLGKK